MIVTFDLGGTNLKTALWDLDDNLIHLDSVSTKAMKGRDAVITLLVNQFIKLMKAVDNKPKALGIGCPGPIDPKTGFVYTLPNFPDWENVALKIILEHKIKIPVIMENDATAAAWGEFKAGAGRNVNNMICVTLGTGIGTGIIIDGKILHGAQGVAGEAGHITILPDGPKCGCGNNGCLETLASATALVRNFKQKMKEKKNVNIADFDISARQVVEDATKGDVISKGAVEETGRYLGIGMATLINIFNPSLIVFSGGLSGAGEMLFEPCRDEINKRAFKLQAEHCQLKIAELQELAAHVGMRELSKSNI